MTIAGLGIQVECTDPDLHSLLARQYASFLSLSDPNISVRIEVLSRKGSLNDLSSAITFRGRMVYFSADNVKGYIDEDQSRAELCFSSQFGFVLTDYFLRVVLAVHAFRSGGLMLHAAGIVHQGMAYLFFGHSGSGKTTISRLSGSDLVLNDDLVVIMPAGETWQVHATPFWNPTQLQPAPGYADLASFYRLVQDQRVYLDSMPVSQATAELIANTPVIPASSARNLELLSRVQSLSQTFPCYQMHFLPDPSFWQVIEAVDYHSGKGNLT